jgi:hypothetical protein
MSASRRVMMYDLLASRRRATCQYIESNLYWECGVQSTYEEIVFSVFENEVNTLLFEHNFPQSRHVLVRDLPVDLYRFSQSSTYCYVQ